jgi:energy-coupling factor transport system substrate-specific component
MGKVIHGKLEGESIPYLARIAAIADTFDAMTSKRSYRDSLDINFVKEEFKNCSGTQFDPKLAELFLDILNNSYKEIEAIQKKYN